ncbi:MAG: hypothetical protein ACUVQ8_03270 [Nitrososphaeria archaeon]
MQCVEFLEMLKPDKDHSLDEVSGDLKVSASLLRNMAKPLEERKLITSRKSGRIKVYRRMIELPKFELSEEPVKLEQVNTSNAKIEETKIREVEVREVVRGDCSELGCSFL